jgi:hypothetical protein
MPMHGGGPFGYLQPLEWCGRASLSLDSPPVRRSEGHGVGPFGDFDGDRLGPAAQSLAGARDSAGERIVGEGEVAREKGKVAGKQG